MGAASQLLSKRIPAMNRAESVGGGCQRKAAYFQQLELGVNYNLSLRTGFSTVERENSFH